MRTEFHAVRSELRSEMNSEFGAVRAETQAMHRTMLQVVFASLGLTLIGFAGTIATILTKADPVKPG